jgi:hypothetical protein
MNGPVAAGRPALVAAYDRRMADLPARLRLVIFDLDGVIRDWNDEDLGLMESSFGLVDQKDPGVSVAM